MDNEKEKTIEQLELDDKDKELIELIRHMNKEDRDKELKEYDELAEKWVREEIEEKYGPEYADFNISSEDIFNIWDVYESDSDMSKISVNGIVDKILKYTEIDHADNLAGKEEYGYRDIAAYKKLLATIIERSHDMSLVDKPIIDKSIKQESNDVKIANNTIAGLIVYLIFIAKSDRFFKYHRIYKSSKEYSLKDHERIIFNSYLEKVAGYINLKNICYTDALNCFDVWPKITLLVEKYNCKIKSRNTSFADGEELRKVIEYLCNLQKQCNIQLKGLLHFSTTISEYKNMTPGEWKDLKIELLCKSLINAVTETIGIYDKAAIYEEKELLLQELSKISSNPGLSNFIDKTTQEQRESLFDKLYEFRLMIDQEISFKK